ncbi:Pentatricopeptide repeat-containing protein At3g47530 [Linum perenne]
MISGLAMNGHGREAIDAFGEMKKAGIQPDDQTHCGLLNEGMTFFDRMSKEFWMQPNIHHYGCMVDLMGRVGKLDQAYELIMSMKEVKPDPAIWSTGEEEKGYVLSYHSEKLAMAFGILATPPGTTIRIAKNLRTCVDCHNFAKAVSWVYNREVVIRDRNRFHHFREGRCSCNDFW